MKLEHYLQELFDKVPEPITTKGILTWSSSAEWLPPPFEPSARIVVIIPIVLKGVDKYIMFYQFFQKRSGKIWEGLRCSSRDSGFILTFDGTSYLDESDVSLLARMEKKDGVLHQRRTVKCQVTTSFVKYTPEESKDKFAPNKIEIQLMGSAKPFKSRKFDIVRINEDSYGYCKKIFTDNVLSCFDSKKMENEMTGWTKLFKAKGKGSEYKAKMKGLKFRPFKFERR